MLRRLGHPFLEASKVAQGSGHGGWCLKSGPELTEQERKRVLEAEGSG